MSDSIHSTDKAWDHFGKEDPYWAVLTYERFHKETLGEDQIREFFKSGEEYIEWVFDMIRKHIDPDPNPVKGLDFGCGVGRLLLPISRYCQFAVGVDVSDGMLKEAGEVCKRTRVSNVTLIKGNDNCTGLNGGFDFINSSIVFQHIPCDRGFKIFQRILEMLNAGGVGAIHFTYSRSNYPILDNKLDYASLSQDLDLGGKHYLRGLVNAVKKRIRKTILDAKSGLKLQPSSSESQPTMQMNAYLLNPIFQILQQSGVREFHIAYSEHSSTMGMVLFFKKGKDEYLFPGLFEK